MDNSFMNSRNSKKCDLQRLLLNLPDKINLKTSDKYVALSNLSIYHIWKKIKKSYKTINSKYQLQRRMKFLSYLADHILYQIFQIISSILSKIMKQLLIILHRYI